MINFIKFTPIIKYYEPIRQYMTWREGVLQVCVFSFRKSKYENKQLFALYFALDI